MKFQNLDRLMFLRSGKLYMKNMDYFRKLERTEKEKYIADSGEDSVILPFGHLKMKSLDGENSIELDINKAIYSGGHLKQPMLCLFSLDYRNIIERDGKSMMVFNEEQKINLKKFGTHVLLFNDADEFIRRVKEKLEEEKIGFRCGFVQYYKDDENIQRFSDIVNNKKHIGFTKDYFPFSQQQEYRILLETQVDDHFILDIKDISDITEIVPIEQVLQRQYEI